MGLDMYLKRTERVEGLTAQDYENINEAVYENGQDLLTGNKSLKELFPEIKNIETLESKIKEDGEYFKWVTALEEVGYWRKANSIHAFFVRECQGGIDECQLSEVPKNKLEQLLESCKNILSKKVNPSKVLPSQGGFFFGSTSYDEYYLEDIKETIRIVEEVLETTDFEKEIIFYRSSW